MRVGETPQEAASRELQEETGLRLPSTELHRFAEYKQPWARHYDHVFYARTTNGAQLQAKSVEINAVGWYVINQLPELTPQAAEALGRWRRRGGHDS